MNQAGTAIATTAAVLAASASTAAVTATAWPFIIEYTGVMQALSVAQNATTAKIVGQGWSMLPASLTTFTGPIPMPITAALRTVVQTATGLNTETNQIVSLGLTVATNTGFSSVTVDELTCDDYRVRGELMAIGNIPEPASLRSTAQAAQIGRAASGGLSRRRHQAPSSAYIGTTSGRRGSSRSASPAPTRRA